MKEGLTKACPTMPGFAPQRMRGNLPLSFSGRAAPPSGWLVRRPLLECHQPERRDGAREAKGHQIIDDPLDVLVGGRGLLQEESAIRAHDNTTERIALKLGDVGLLGANPAMRRCAIV